MSEFSRRLLRWHSAHGRHDLPWQHPRTPYRVWLSEIMLQQTQVLTVVGYFQRFLARFPDLAALAAADLDQVLQLWAGLGYYARARNLHACARACLSTHGGELPRDVNALRALPGIGRSTAGAIAAQAFGLRAPILDANVKRVLARFTGERRAMSLSAPQEALWVFAEQVLPRQSSQMPDYTQAMMDLGAQVCTAKNPQCGRCPLRQDCVALAADLVDQLPMRAAKRAHPTKHCVWLLAQDDLGRMLLMQRPNSGIWGGLHAPLQHWCADASSVKSVRVALQKAAGAPSGAFAWQDADAPLKITHRFTHYTLQARVLQARVNSVWELPPGLQWHSRAQLKTLALPTPIRRLLMPEPAID